MTTAKIRQMKGVEKIAMLTAYDYTLASCLRICLSDVLVFVVECAAGAVGFDAYYGLEELALQGG